jgi:20S proteasome alpha/beta subunit
MTYIAAFGCKDGIVMCADTQETVGSNKDYSEKISIVDDLSYPLAIGGAGYGPLIDCMTDEIIERAKAEQPASKKALKALITAALREVYANDLPALTTRRIDKAPQLLIAAKTSEDGFCIYQTAGRRVVGEISRGIIGFSTAYNMNLLRRLHQPSLPMQQAVMLAVYLVSQSKQLDDGVGFDTRVAVITNNGAWIDDPEYIAEAEKRVEEFLKLTDEMFLTCIDVSIAPSDHIVKNTLLTQRIDALRERYLRDSATRSLIRTFSDPTYCGEPYAKIFPGATIEFGGSSGVTVRETTEQELKNRRELFAAAQQGYNRKALDRFNALIANRTPVYLGEETVHVQGTVRPIVGAGS